MTRRRWIANTWERSGPEGGTAALTGDQAAHLARVLRAQPGQIFDVVAGGFLHRAEVISVSPDEVRFTLHEEMDADAALPLHLLLAVYKFDHMEWAIEKATELGVAAMTPVLARRTEKHLAQAAAKRVERWRRIAHEASQQSRRTTVPELHDPVTLKLALAALAQVPVRILLSETEQALPLATALREAANETTGNQSPQTHQASPGNLSLSSEKTITHALAIGPEGGWTPEEMQLFHDAAWRPVTLGPRILRAETAAIAAIAIAGSLLV
jgi:16S rRNA (uracil1498-N3)-methyltransferase